jgi:hypothetical protein
MKLLKTLKGIQAGELEDKHGWRQQVFEPKEESVQNGANGTVDAVNGL